MYRQSEKRAKQQYLLHMSSQYVNFDPLAELCRCKIYFAFKSCILLFWQHYCTALEQWASAKLCGMVQGMKLWNFRSSLFSTERAIYIPSSAIMLGIGPHSSSILLTEWNFAVSISVTVYFYFSSMLWECRSGHCVGEWTFSSSSSSSSSPRCVCVLNWRN